MAQAVQIQITVDGSQAQQALGQIDNALSSVGIKGQSSFKQAGDAAKTAGGHFTTSLDAVRLLSQEFGFRLPRAIESMLARVPQVTSALSGMLGVMASIAAAEVFVRVAQGVYKAYNEYISLNAQADKFYETLKKTQEQDVVNTRSIETTQMRSGMAQRGARVSQGAAQVFHGSALGDFVQGNIAGALADLAISHSLAGDAVKSESDLIKLGKVDLDQTHQRALAQIELNHAMDSALGPRARAAAEARKKIQIDAENREFDRRQEQYYGNPSAANAGASDQQIKDAQARAAQTAQDIMLDRKERDERIAAHNEAVNAGLEGEAKYLAQRDEAIATIVRKYKDGEITMQTARSVTASLERKYDNERTLRLERLIDESNQIAAQAANAGLHGAGLIQSQLQEQLAGIDKRQRVFSGGDALSPAAQAAFDKERTAAHTVATQKLTELEDNFADHVRSLTDGRVSASLNAYQKIDSEAQKQVSDLQKLYDDDFKNAQLSDAQKLQAERNLQAGISAIDSAANAQKQQLDARNREEDMRFDQEAAAAERRVKEDGINGWVASYRNALVEIQADEQQRLQKLQDDVTKEGLTWPEAEKRRSDIIRTTNAQIADANLQMQHQIANTLQEAFTNPVEFIKSRMERMFFEIIAAWIMRMNMFKGLFGQTMGSLQPGGSGASAGSGLGGILGAAGSLMPGMSGTRGIVNGSPSAASIYAPAGSGGSSAASTISNISSTASTIGGLIPGASSSSASWDPLLKNAQDVTGTAGAASTSLASRANFAVGAAGVGLGGYTGFQSTLDAFKSGDPLKGAMGDASAGATIGMMAGPVGALVGAAIGAGVGATAGLVGMVGGESRKLGARDYYEKNVFPQLEQSMTMTNADFQSAMSSVGNTATQAMAYMQLHFGRDAADWVQSNYMQKEVTRVLQSIEDKAGGGRQYLMRSASQYHSGGVISGFGDLATSGNEGFIHAMLNETVMNPSASALHGNVLSAMNGGAGVSDVAAMYLAQARPSVSMPSASSGGDTHHWTVNALDASSFSRFLRDGGAQQIVKHVNRYASQYAGDGING